MQLIFDPSQEDGKNEIWIDVYEIIEFLRKNTSYVIKDSSKEYQRFYDFTEPNLEN